MPDHDAASNLDSTSERLPQGVQGRAAVFHGPGQPLEMRRFNLPTLLAGEALVRVTCCTLCGSDLSTLDGHRQEPVPCVLGHEIIGIVEAVGGDKLFDLRGRVVQPGQRVVWSVAASCDVCQTCRRGWPQKCDKLLKYGHHRIDDHWQFSGGLAEYCHLMRGTKLLIIEPADEDSQASLPDETLCPASCATATVAAAFRTARIAPSPLSQSRSLIFGAGMLGLTACAMARALHGQEVTVCDTSLERLALAERFGANRLLPWSSVRAWLDASKGNGPLGDQSFDTVFELSGNLQAVEAAIRLADVGGSVVLVGSVRPTPPLNLYPEHVVRRLLSIHGVHNYRPDDLLAAVEFLHGAGRNYPFAELVSKQCRLEELNAALQSPEHRAAIRLAVRP